VVNASISGETTSGGAARIAATLDEVKPTVLILALGANDGLRGLPVKQMQDNLARIVSAAQRRQSKVVIAGMRMPPNYGARYTEQFRGVYSDLARQTHSALIPFLLDGIVQRPELFQQDNLHPTEAAQPIILETVWKALQPILK
jgi:acyl-CoA thioesterase I